MKYTKKIIVHVKVQHRMWKQVEWGRFRHLKLKPQNFLSWHSTLQWHRSGGRLCQQKFEVYYILFLKEKKFSAFGRHTYNSALSTAGIYKMGCFVRPVQCNEFFLDASSTVSSQSESWHLSVSFSGPDVEELVLLPSLPIWKNSI